MSIGFVLLAALAMAPALRGGEVSFSSSDEVKAAMYSYAAALKKGNPEEVSRWYAKDGELLLPGMAPLRGPDAIRSFLTPLVSTTEVESVTVTTDLVAAHGDSADLWGTYHQVAGEKGKPKQAYDGRYAALWHREPGGEWLLVRLMMQPVPADAK